MTWPETLEIQLSGVSEINSHADCLLDSPNNAASNEKIAFRKSDFSIELRSRGMSAQC